MIQSIEKVYAAALVDLAEEAGSTDEVADQMAQIGRLIDEQPDLVRLISTRTLSVAQRRSVIEQLFKERASELVYRFLQVLNAKDRLDRLVPIIAAVGRSVQQRRGVVPVDVFVASALDEAGSRHLAERLGQVVHGTVQLHQHVQSDLIGGLLVRIGDRLIDGSIAAQLRQIGRKIAAGGRQQAGQRQDAAVGP